MLLGQDSTSVPTSRTTIVDRRFPVGDPVLLRVSFERGKVYRVWLSRPGLIRGLRRERRIFPFIVDVTHSSLIENGVEFELYPSYTGPVTLIVEPPTPDSVTDVVIWHDNAGTVRGDRDGDGANESWEFGVEMSGGWHARMGSGAAGEEFEGCLGVRRGGGRTYYLSGCFLGLAAYQRPGGTAITIFFLEPRWRLAGEPLTIQHGGTEVGVALRLGLFGSAAGYDPAWGGADLLGFGPYLEHAFGDATHASGLGLRLSAMEEAGGTGRIHFVATNVRLGATYHF